MDFLAQKKVLGKFQKDRLSYLSNLDILYSLTSRIKTMATNPT